MLMLCAALKFIMLNDIVMNAIMLNAMAPTEANFNFYLEGSNSSYHIYFISSL